MITNRHAWQYKFAFIITAILMAPNVDAQSADQEIKALITEQSEAWNAGDIEGFMAEYTKSEDLHFLGANGLTAGWHATLERYKQRYPDQQTMGQLTFDLKEITKRTKDVYTVVGKYHLSRQEMDDTEGFFLLVVQKIKGKWKVVADSTH